MWWITGTVANAVISVAYFMICFAILRPLVREGQLRVNKLGTATGIIFFTCAVHHGTHSVHMLGPSLGYDQTAGEALRASFSLHNALWDVFGGVVALYYWNLRATYGPLMRGAALFEDLKERQRQALQINDDIVQGLTVAKLALELGERQRTQAALDEALTSASRIISDLLGQADAENRLGPGNLVRDRPANLSNP